LAAHLGDRRTAASAVDGLLSTIVETVKAGESVSLTGFGVFEARARAARVGRNPRTGETVKIKRTSVPKFKAGTAFKVVVADPRKLPKAAPAGGRAPAGTSTAALSGARKTTAKKAATKKATSTAKKTTAKKSTAKATPAAKKSTARKTTKATPARSTAKKTTAKKSTAKKSTTKRTARAR
jgi:DNA-binding protein HU-beta